MLHIYLIFNQISIFLRYQPAICIIYRPLGTSEKERACLIYNLMLVDKISCHDL